MRIFISVTSLVVSVVRIDDADGFGKDFTGGPPLLLSAFAN